MAGDVQHQLLSQITTHLQTVLSINPSPSYLGALLTSLQKPNTPLAALQRTVQFRILSTSVTHSLSTSNLATLFPSDVHSSEIEERRLPGPVAVQIVGIEDVGHSRMAQIEGEDERVANLGRGEKFRIVGLQEEDVQDGEDEGGGVEHPQVVGGGTKQGAVGAGAKTGPHKLLLQDAAGKTCYGFETEGIAGVKIGMDMGCKLILKDVLLARGLLLLDRGCVTMLGGKIEALDKVWKDGWLKKLKEEIGYQGRENM